MMPFEWDVRVSSKDHAVAASMSITMTNPATALHHYAGHNCGSSWQSSRSDTACRVSSNELYDGSSSVDGSSVAQPEHAATTNARSPAAEVTRFFSIVASLHL